MKVRARLTRLACIGLIPLILLLSPVALLGAATGTHILRTSALGRPMEPRTAVARSVSPVENSAAANYSGVGWEPVAVDQGPSERDSAAMVYDDGDGYVLLFGGSAGTCSGDYPFVCNDTWSYHGGTWTNRNLSAAPGPRSNALIAYDAADQCVVLFGGEASWEQNGGSVTRSFNDTWTYRNGTWHNVTRAVAPPAATANTEYAGMAFDAADGYLVYASDSPGTRYLNGSMIQTWVFENDSWSRLTSADAPGFLSQPIMVDDPAEGEVVVSPVEELTTVPGIVPITVYNSWWGFRAGAWSQLGVPGLDRTGSAADFLPSADAVIGFGGTNRNEDSAGTWFLQGLTLWNRTFFPTPSARQSASAAFDPSDGYFLVFGGTSPCAGTCQDLNDSWAFRPGDLGPPSMSVQVDSTPGRCAPLLWDSTRVANGTSVLTYPGIHRVEAPPCPGFQFESWTTTGGLGVNDADANATVDVSANGTLTANYLASFSIEVTVVPAACGPVLVGSSWVGNGTEVSVAYNRLTSVTAFGCAISPYRFEGWSVSAALSMNGSRSTNASGQVVANGNGTLTAVYGPVPMSSGSQGSVPLVDAALAFGVGLALGALGTVFLLRGRNRSPPTKP